MAVDKDTVKRVAKLACIRIGDEEAQSLSGELSNILGWVEQLNELNTDDVAPMTSVVAVTLPMREDVVTDGRCTEAIVKNAPERAEDFFLVPKVIG